MNCEITNTPERNLEAPEGNDNNTLYASEVANDILNDVLSEYDITTWKSLTDADQAAAFRELIGIYASYKFRDEISGLENRSELLSELVSQLELTLIAWAKDEGYN